MARGLGHPLQLGPYQGFATLGTGHRPSRVFEAGPPITPRPQPQGLGVAIRPLRSLVQGLPCPAGRAKGGSL